MRTSGAETDRCCACGDLGETAGAGGRTYHHTAPTAMVAALHAGLGRVLEEGLDAVIAGEFAASVWRTGLMGYNARPDIVTLILGALGNILGRR